MTPALCHSRHARRVAHPALPLILTLTACTPVPPLPEGIAPISAEEAVVLQSIAGTEADLTAFYADTTSRSFTPWQGNRVAYHAADGTVVLWQPEETDLLRADWRVEQAPGERRARMCYRFDAPRDGEDTWSCRFAAESLYLSDEVVAGDPLGLAAGTLPFVMPSGVALSLAALAARLERPAPEGPNRVTWSWRKGASLARKENPVQ